MDKVNFQENLFIGSSELKSLQNFSNSLLQILGSMTKNFGLIEPEDAIRLENTDLVDKTNRKCFQLKSGSNSILTFNTPSYAFSWNQNTNEYNLISWKRDREIQLPDSYRGNSYYVKISYSSNSIESGSLKINSNGDVTGIGTNFTDKLRSGDFGSLIKLYTYNGLSYEYVSTCVVNSVNSDTSISIKEQGTGTIPSIAPAYYYSIAGTFPIGNLNTQNNDLYIYDSSQISFIKIDDNSIIPDEFEMMNSSSEFYVAKIDIASDGTVTVTDKRFIFENVENDTNQIYSKWFKMK